jgi:hypothetical protein
MCVGWLALFFFFYRKKNKIKKQIKHSNSVHYTRRPYIIIHFSSHTITVAAVYNMYNAIMTYIMHIIASSVGLSYNTGLEHVQGKYIYIYIYIQYIGADVPFSNAPHRNRRVLLQWCNSISGGQRTVRTVRVTRVNPWQLAFAFISRTMERWYVSERVTWIKIKRVYTYYLYCTFIYCCRR